MLSPLAWKAYYVFCFPAVFVGFALLYRSAPAAPGWVRACFHLGWGLQTLSSELFVGRYASDVAEAHSAILVGGLCLCAVMVWGSVAPREVALRAAVNYPAGRPAP